MSRFLLALSLFFMVPFEKSAAEEISKEQMTDYFRILQSLDRLGDQSSAQCRLSSDLSLVFQKYQVCSKRKEYIEHRIQHSRSIDETVQKISSSDAQLILLGETHLTRSIEEYPKLIEQFKKNSPTFDCLFIEMPSLSSADFMILLADGDQEPKNRALLPYKSTIQKASALGLRVIPVDTEQPKSDAEAISRASIRDQAMAKNAGVQFNQKHCHRAIQIVGKNHLTNDIDDPNRVTLPSQLRKENIKFVTVNIQNTGITPYSGKLDSSWYWKSCVSNPEIPDRAFAFEKDTAPGDSPFFQRGGKWSDFDFTFIFPDGK